MKPFILLSLAALLTFCSLVVAPVALTGCTTISGTNTFDVTAAATAIRTVLGPVVVYEEASDPSTIPDFQLASAALGVMISNNSTNAAAVSAALQGVSKDPLVKAAISAAVNLYSGYLAQSVSAGIDGNSTAKVLLQAFKDALDQGVKANAKRVRARRAAVRMS